jgi:NADH-quinone oxidoreductase subunit E
MGPDEEAQIDMKGLDEILARYPGAGRNDLIPLLQEVQQAYGYLPPTVLAELSRRTGVAASQIYGVATFYEQFYLEPHGRHTLRCCRGTACHVRGGSNIIKTLKRTIGIEPGETTEDMEFTFETVACLGACALAPVMVVDGTYHGKMSFRKVGLVVDSTRTAGKEDS